MQYLVWGAARPPAALAGAERLAHGDCLELEGPWPLGPVPLSFVRAKTALEKADAASGAYAVEGFDAPGDGNAFVVAAHMMLDAQKFKPYADAIPAMLQKFGVRSLARAGTVTPLGGPFTPQRAVVLQFRDVDAVLDFYMSDEYAPLLALRKQTTDPRFIVLSRDGAISQASRQRTADFLRGIA